MKHRCGNRGRGVVAVQHFAKGQILADYHARAISRGDAESILRSLDEQDRRSDYIFCAPGLGLYLDGSQETCHCHPQNRIMGRLLNFAPRSSDECNVKTEYFEHFTNGKLFKTLLFVALRDICPSEELRFDYGDENCRSLFC